MKVNLKVQVTSDMIKSHIPEISKKESIDLIRSIKENAAALEQMILINILAHIKQKERNTDEEL